MPFHQLQRSTEQLDLLHAIELGTEATMHAKDPLPYDSGDGKETEQVDEHAPELNTEAPLTLVVESVDSGYL
jgi:hypothetical protein